MRYASRHGKHRRFCSARAGSALRLYSQQVKRVSRKFIKIWCPVLLDENTDGWLGFSHAFALF